MISFQVYDYISAIDARDKMLCKALGYKFIALFIHPYCKNRRELSEQRLPQNSFFLKASLHLSSLDPVIISVSEEVYRLVIIFMNMMNLR
jgi:hypothetical protein